MSSSDWQWPDGAGLDARWTELWRTFEVSDAGHPLKAWLQARVQAGASIAPSCPLRALALTRFHEVRAVILGQDPYHGPGQAHGLAFSVPDGVAAPPSLRNIYREVAEDLGTPLLARGSLENWAQQGVLLLNVVLTVELGAPASHANRGWERFTASVIEALARDSVPKAFLLWGAFAQRFAGAIAAHPQHLVLTANHPSPLSARRPPAPFLGCRHFSRANAFLTTHGRGAIDWQANP